MEGDLSLADALEHVIRRWYVVAIAGIIGGVAGLLYSLAQPPVFDAFAVLTVALNFDLTQPLSQYDKDLAQGKVAGVVVADLLWEQALQKAGIQPMPQPNDPGSSNPVLGHRLERKGTRWEFTVSSHDPVIAARVANAWAAGGMATLAEAQQYAFEARNLQVRLDRLLINIADMEADPGVGKEQLEPLLQATNRLQSRIQEQLEAAQGVASFISFDLTQEAAPPDRPATRGRGQLVLAGTAIGGLVGVVLAIGPGTLKSDRRSPT